MAVIGAGRIGRVHIDLVARSPACELSGIVDSDPQTAALAAAAGVPHYAGLEQLLATDPPDAVIIATPNAAHVSHALDCIRAGVAILVEKPIASNVADAMRLAATADRARVPLLVGHHRRHSPILAAARDIIAEGRLGQMVAVSGTALFHKPGDYFESAPWRRKPGGGPILINLVHEIDDLRMLVGDVVAVSATASNRARGLEVEDTVALTMRFANGALGTFLLSDVAASPLSWEMTSGEDDAYPHYVGEDCYVIAGTHGSLAVPTLRVHVYDGEPSWHRPFRTFSRSVHRADPLARQLDHFCAVLRGTERPLVSGRDAAETLRVTLAVAEAVHSGCTVACAPAAAP